MPRKPRLWYEGAMYHIMTRGNHRADVFREYEDYLMYLIIIEVTKRKYPFYLLSFCLMTNHIHLQIKTVTIQPGKIMKHINLLYTQYMNRKYSLVGHLFQGRYCSEIIETDSYSLHLSRYIHLNPIKARMVEKPSQYSWSSYSTYMGESKCGFLDEALILNHFKTNARDQYRDFVEGNKAGKASEPIFLDDQEVV